jgi:hypothetical protein
MSDQAAKFALVKLESLSPQEASLRAKFLVASVLIHMQLRPIR